MSELSFEIFKNIEDRYNWDKYIEFIQRTDEVEDEQKVKLIDTYKTFKKELGKGFLKNSKGKGHIITNYTFSRGEESYSWLIWLAENLNYFRERSCNYGELMKKLHSASNFRAEGLPFIEIADNYRKAGFDIVFEPFKNSNRKKPDLKITNPSNGEIFFIEISKLNDSQDRIDKRNIYQTVFNEFISAPVIPFAGKIISKAKNSEVIQIVHKIKEFKVKAKNEDRFLIFSDDKINFAVSSENKEEKVKEWSIENNYDYGNIISLPFNPNETKRIIGNKLPQKAPQIPSNKFGLIYIPVNPLYFYVKNPFEITEEIENKLIEYKYNNILGVVIYSKIGDESDNKGYFDKLHFFGTKTIHKTLRRDILFVFNKECTVKMFPNTLERIYSTLDN